MKLAMPRSGTGASMFSALAQAIDASNIKKMLFIYIPKYSIYIYSSELN